jgi:hypothetical protein
MGRTPCTAVGRFYAWAGRLDQVLHWNRARLVGQILSALIAMPIFLTIFGVTSFAVTLTWPINLALACLIHQTKIYVREVGIRAWIDN